MFLLQSNLDTTEGIDLPHAMSEYIKKNDVAILESCDKVSRE